MDVVGTTLVRSCCTFVWRQDPQSARRTVVVRPYHCAACVDEMVRSAQLQRVTIARSGGISMERVREVLARRRPELIDRWARQLRAAAEAGFALDAATGQVLPLLLDALDASLQRRFQALRAGLPANVAEARRAAMQASLLGDYLFDTVVESLPELNSQEQRVISEALAHAGVEVLVRLSLEREQDRRRRDGARLAKLAHELRESTTAARLALDLLQRRKMLPDHKLTRTLERSLARIRTGVEDSLLDEVLASGGLRLSRVDLVPVLDGARAEVPPRNNVQLLVEKAEAAVTVNADPRIVGPAVRGLLAAALEMARPGSTVRVQTRVSGQRGCVAVTVPSCSKVAGKRLAGIPALSFARRAARAHGGSLVARLSREDGCELRMELPAIH